MNVHMIKRMCLGLMLISILFVLSNCEFENVTFEADIKMYTDSKRLVFGRAIKGMRTDWFVAAEISGLAEGKYALQVGDWEYPPKMVPNNGNFMVSSKDLVYTKPGDKIILIQKSTGGELLIAVYKPDEIYTLSDLRAVRLDLSGNYTLMKDIVALPDDAEFTPIGNEDTPFLGTLNGNKKSITGLKIHGSNYAHVGLFGVIQGKSADTVVVKDLMLYDMDIQSSYEYGYAGAVAGYVERGIVQGVSLSLSPRYEDMISKSNGAEVNFNFGQILAIDGTAGGLAGRVGDNAVLLGFTKFLVQSNVRAGGLAGHNSGVVVGYTEGMVGNYTHKAGVADAVPISVNASSLGLRSAASDTSLRNTAPSVLYKFSQSSAVSGGLVGYNSGTVIGYALGTVIGDDVVGGLVGDTPDSVPQSANVAGYVRSNIRYSNSIAEGDRLPANSKIAFGIGNASSDLVYSIYVSNTVDAAVSSETFVLDMAGGAIRGVNTVNFHGTVPSYSGGGVAIATANRNSFSELVFTDKGGPWVWVADGKWPALDLGSSMLPKDQPID